MNKDKFLLLLTLQLFLADKVILERSGTASCECAENISDAFYSLFGQILSEVLGVLLARHLAPREGSKHSVSIRTLTCKVSVKIHLGEVSVTGEADGFLGKDDVTPLYIIAGISLSRTLRKAIKSFRPRKAEVSHEHSR